MALYWRVRRTWEDAAAGSGPLKHHWLLLLHHLVLKVWLQDQKPPRNILFLYCNKAAVCAYACVYVCICMHVYVCVCAYVCMCMHVYMCVCVLLCMCVHLHMCASVYICAHVHVYIYVCVCMYNVGK